MKRAFASFSILVSMATAFLSLTVGKIEAQQPALTLHFPLVVSQNSLLTGIAVVNNDTTSQVPANVEFTAYNETGTVISGPNIRNPVRKSIAPGNQMAEVLQETFGDGFNNFSGWMKMTSDSAKVRGFFMIFDSNVNVMDGTDVGPETPREVVLPDVSSSLINVVNPNNADSLAVFQVRGNAGSVLATANRLLPPFAKMLVPATSLFVPPLRGIPSDSYVTVSSELPLVTLTLLGDQLQSKFIAALNGQANSGGGTLLYCPQFVNDAFYASEMNIINLENRPGLISLRYIGDNGTSIGSEATRVIPALGTIKVIGPSIFGIDPAVRPEQGYVVIDGNGIRLTGSVKFGDPAKERFQTALPFVSTLRKSVLFSQVAQGVSGFFTGAAVLNPGSTAITITTDVYDSGGVRKTGGTKTIPPRGRVVFLLSEFDSALALSKGYFRITSADNFASFAVFGMIDLRVLSAIPPQIP